MSKSIPGALVAVMMIVPGAQEEGRKGLVVDSPVFAADNPQETRERTDEGMELILKAWTEPRPFGWQGRHFRYISVSFGEVIRSIIP